MIPYARSSSVLQSMYHTRMTGDVTRNPLIDHPVEPEQCEMASKVSIHGAHERIEDPINQRQDSWIERIFVTLLNYNLD